MVKLKQQLAGNLCYQSPTPFHHGLQYLLLRLNDKASGEDFLLSEFFKTNVDWWASLRAGLFTHINKTGCVPKGWNQSIIVPIFKKGDGKNYTPIH